jgi:hypothetical protein
LQGAHAGELVGQPPHDRPRVVVRRVVRDGQPRGIRHLTVEDGAGGAHRTLEIALLVVHREDELEHRGGKVRPVAKGDGVGGGTTVADRPRRGG